MSRDMQIGLLLAVGFLALVGGVLYYRIEHPDDLEQFWNGEQVAQATATETQSTLAAAPPNPMAPTLESTATLEPKPVPASTTAPGVVLTQATGTAPASPTPPAFGDVKFTLDQTATAPVATKTEDAKPVPTQPTQPKFVLNLPKQELPKKELPKQELTPPAVPNLTTDIKPLTTKVEEKPLATRQSFPNDTAATTNPPASNPPAPMAPAAPALGNTAPTLGTQQRLPDEMPQNSPAAAPPAPSVAAPPLLGSGSTTSTTPPALNHAPPAAAAPPASGNAPAPPTITFDDPARKPPVSTPPDLTQQSKEMPRPPNLTASGSTNPPGVVTELKPTPTTPTSPLNAPIAPDLTESRVSPDGRYREYTSPKATLGRPVPESESAQRERRWAEGSGAPSPIVPSSADVPGKAARGSVGAATIAAGERRVVSNAYVPRERAVQGETFSSLSQRLYGDIHYAAALAAYNRDEGFVETDQPVANQWVAKPNREVLDLKYAHLVRPGTRPAVAREGALPGTPGRANVSTRNDPPAVPTGDLPIYRVRPNEQLFEVAKKTLGDGYRWSEIYALNKELLRDSTELRADMVLKLPGDAKLDGPKAR